MSLKPQRLSRRTIYENPWVNLYVDAVHFPDGRIIEQHHVLEFEKEAVAVVVENADRDILFVHAYRYVTDSIEWEIPAGGVDVGESIIDTAIREVREESGYDLVSGRVMYSYYPMNGIANKRFHIVRGTAGEHHGTFDKNEINTVQWRSFQEIHAMIRQQEIHDGFTLTALLLYTMMAGHNS